MPYSTGENSAVSAASQKDVKAVIKMTASAASLKTKIQGSIAVPAVRMPSRCPWAPLDFDLQGGCASSRLDHGFQILAREAARAANWIAATPKWAEQLSKNYEFESIMIILTAI